MGTLTVSLAKGETEGKSIATVSDVLASGEKLKYKVYTSGNGNIPTLDTNVQTWSNLTSGVTEISAEVDKELVIVKCDSEYKAKAGAKVIFTADDIA